MFGGVYFGQVAPAQTPLWGPPPGILGGIIGVTLVRVAEVYPVTAVPGTPVVGLRAAGSRARALVELARVKELPGPAVAPHVPYPSRERIYARKGRVVP